MESSAVPPAARLWVFCLWHLALTSRVRVSCGPLFFCDFLSGCRLRECPGLSVLCYIKAGSEPSRWILLNGSVQGVMQCGANRRAYSALPVALSINNLNLCQAIMLGNKGSTVQPLSSECPYTCAAVQTTSRKASESVLLLSAARFISAKDSPCLDMIVHSSLFVFSR